jgi:hypothetical protein
VNERVGPIKGTACTHPHYDTCPPNLNTLNTSHIAFSTTHPSMQTQSHLPPAHTTPQHLTSPTASYTPQDHLGEHMASRLTVRSVIVSHEYVTMQVLSTILPALSLHEILQCHALSRWSDSAGPDHQLRPQQCLQPQAVARVLNVKLSVGRPEFNGQTLPHLTSGCSSLMPASHSRMLTGSLSLGPPSRLVFVKSRRAVTFTPSQSMLRTIGMDAALSPSATSSQLILQEQIWPFQRWSTSLNMPGCPQQRTKWLEPSLTISEAQGVTAVCAIASNTDSPEDVVDSAHTSTPSAPGTVHPRNSRGVLQLPDDPPPVAPKSYLGNHRSPSPMFWSHARFDRLLGGLTVLPSAHLKLCLVQGTIYIKKSGKTA